MMNRRRFLQTMSASGLAVPLTAEAQQAANIPRAGFLSPSSLSDSRTLRYFQAFRQGLRELGHVEGQNIAILMERRMPHYRRNSCATVAEGATELAVEVGKFAFQVWFIHRFGWILGIPIIILMMTALALFSQGMNWLNELVKPYLVGW